ncbi:hypothetical protein KKHLCK_16005 [Candidatus Electrothrix laxa]
MQTSIREEKLSEEIIDAHRTRADFLKWKLLISAALGAAGLGLSKDTVGKDTTALLALIPLVCVYVDLLCTNLNQRIILIGTHFAQQHGDAYECRCRAAGDKGWFNLEDSALYGSTYAACIILFMFAAGKLWKTGMANEQWLQPGAVILGSITGLILTRITKIKVSRIREKNAPFPVQHTDIQPYLRGNYLNQDIVRLETYLTEAGTFKFNCLENGLFPAVGEAEKDDLSGYQYAWVRDNVHIAHAHYVWGAKHTALKTANALMDFFTMQQDRIQRIINDPSLAEDPMNRPHIRFNGRTLQMLAEKWAHAQNDALGYFIWFYCKTAGQRTSGIDDRALDTLALLILYLQKICYWEDRDSGHWEEERKIGASSIGAVVAGLRQLITLCSDQSLYERHPLSVHGIDVQFLNKLEEKGVRALNQILPYESVDPDTKRRYDAALLFLIYPLEVVTSDQAMQILTDVKSALQGEIGIRRYPNDSYWYPNYRDSFALGARSTDFSDNMSQRDSHRKEGMEAQWCIFDSIISCIHGMRVLRSKGGEEEWNEQIRYLNRSLGQLTANKKTGILDTIFGWMKPRKQKEDSGALCPEAYFYEKGRLVPNDHVPLQWAQANLKMALYWLNQSTLARKKTM